MKEDIEEKIMDIVTESKSELYSTKMPVDWSEIIASYILAREKKLLRDIKKELFEWAKKEGFLDNNSFTFPSNQIIDKKLKERE